MSTHDMQGNDYVSVAKFRMEGVHDWQSDEGITDATLICAALDAQTQATLALAFEQRTANLIALWTAPAKNTEGVYDRGEELAGVSYGRIADQIKERLGLA